MQGKIHSPILGIDTITKIKDTKSAVVRVMKIHIDADENSGPHAAICYIVGNLTREAPIVWWFEQSENIEMQDS